MVSRTATVKNPSGLHLRPAGVLRKEALRYKSRMSFEVRTTTANVKGVLSILGTYVKSEDEIEFICEEPDKEETLEAIVDIVGAGLGE